MDFEINYVLYDYKQIHLTFFYNGDDNDYNFVTHTPMLSVLPLI